MKHTFTQLRRIREAEGASDQQSVGYLFNCGQIRVSGLSLRAPISVKTVPGNTPVKHKKTRFSRFIGPEIGLVVRVSDHAHLCHSK